MTKQLKEMGRQMAISENTGPGRANAACVSAGTRVCPWNSQDTGELRMHVGKAGRRDEERVNCRPEILKGLVDYSKVWLFL